MGRYTATIAICNFLLGLFYCFKRHDPITGMVFFAGAAGWVGWSLEEGKPPLRVKAPKCFGTTLSYQDQAEHDCISCPFKRECLERSKTDGKG